MGSAIANVLDQGEPPEDEHAATAGLLCRVVGPCDAAGCPPTHRYCLPITGPVRVVLTSLQRAM